LLAVAALLTASLLFTERFDALSLVTVVLPAAGLAVGAFAVSEPELVRAPTEGPSTGRANR
jgi:hypothetical protein